MDKEDLKDVSIPASLYEKIEEMIKGTSTESVSEYVTQIVKKSLEKKAETPDSLSKEDEEKVKQRLKALGYLD